MYLEKKSHEYKRFVELRILHIKIKIRFVKY